MSNLSDKEIDRLSREAADSYEPDDSSLSWSRLEQKLTEQMPGRPPDGFRLGRINPYIWGPAAVLIAGISFFLIKNNIYSPSSTRTNQVSKQKSSSESVKTAADIPDLSVEKANEKAKPEADPKEGNTIRKTLAMQPGSSSGMDKTGHELTIAKSGESLSADGSLLSDGGKAGSGFASGYSKNTGNGKKGNRNKSAGIYVAKSDLATVVLVGSGETTGINDPAEGNAGGPKGRDRSGLGLPSLIRSGTSPGQIKGNDSLLNRSSESVHPVKSMHINRSLNIGFAFGPDYSNAGGIANNQISNNIGLTIGYYLTGRLSLNTGVFYSNKFYWSPGKSSHPQATPVPALSTGVNYYAAPPPVEYVNGSCNMYEVPLTLRYDFAGGEKTKFFANAGLSSYFMVKQTYIYFFHNGMRALAWKTTNNQQQNYWLAVAALSMGMETEIGKGFSFQAEPFLRLPLKSMGVENIKINSYGFLLSFRYSPVLSRSKR